MQQTVKATVDTNGNVLGLTNYGAQSLIPSSVWNNTLYEEGINFGNALNSTGFIQTQFPEIIDTADSYFFPNQVLTTYVDLLVNHNASLIQDESDIQALYQQAGQVLFASMLSNLRNVTRSNRTEQVMATETFNSIAVVVIQPIAIVVESFLLIILSLCMFLTVYNWDRQTSLHSDPASMANLMSLVSDSANFWNILAKHDNGDQKSFLKELSKDQYKYKMDWNEHQNTNCLIVISPKPDIIEASIINNRSRRSRTRTISPRPWQLSPITGSIFASILVGLLSSLLILWFKDAQSNGFSLTISSPFAIQILISYIPTGIATILEPCWILLARTACGLQPFWSMQSRLQPPQRSLTLKYAGVPPAVAIFSALKNSHFLLASLCLSSVLMSPLAIAMSSIFANTSINIQRGSNLTQFNLNDMAQQVVGAAPSNMLPAYAASPVLRQEVPHLAWTMDGVFFMPFNHSTTIVDTVSIQANTTGLRASLNCSPLSNSNSSVAVQLRSVSNTETALSNPDQDFLTAQYLSVNFTTTLGSTGLELNVLGGASPGALTVGTVQPGATSPLTAPSTNGTNYEPINYQFLWPLASESSGPAKAAFAMSATGGNGAEGTFHNSDLLLIGWLQADIVSHSENQTLDGRYEYDQFSNFESSLAICSPTISIADFNVLVDPVGNILSYSQLNNYTELANETFPRIFSYYQDISIAIHQLNSFNSPILFQTNGIARDWLTYMLPQSSISLEILNPHSPLVPIDQAIGVLSDTIANLMAFWFAKSLDTNGMLSKNIPGTIVISEARIKLAKLPVFASVGIFAFTLTNAVIFYFSMWRKEFNDAPVSIASSLRLLQDGTLLTDVMRTAFMTSKQKKQLLVARDGRYGMRKRLMEDGSQQWEVYKG
jgi:hypothetical protein